MKENLVKVKEFGLSTLKSKQFQRFFIIGITAFIIDFTLLQIFLRIFNISSQDYAKETLANIGSAIISIVINYIIQRNWAFESKNKNIASEATKFIGVHAFNLVVYQGILFTAVNVFLPSWLTKIGVTSVQILSSFVFYKFFVFKTKKVTEVEVVATIESGLN